MGLLYYMKSDKLVGTPVDLDELRALLIRRNELAYYVQSSVLPPTLQNDRSCSWCRQLDKCTLYHKVTNGVMVFDFKAFENGTAETSGMPKLFNERTAHLSKQHIRYFLHWDNLIELERDDVRHFRKEIWSLSGLEREKLGRQDYLCSESLCSDALAL